MNEYDRLEKRLKDQQVLLDQEREYKKKRPNERMDEGKPDRLNTYSFWCDLCDQDFDAPCYKTKHRLHGDTIAVYRTKCPDCEQECIRHITHRDHDLFYYKSTKIRKQRNQYFLETLQAKDYGFRTCYGDPYAGFDEVQQAKEETEMMKQQEMGFKGVLI